MNLNITKKYLVFIIFIMTAILNNLILYLIALTKYILGISSSVLNFLLEQSIAILITPVGFVTMVSLVIIVEAFIAESIINDIQKINFAKMLNYIRRSQTKYIPSKSFYRKSLDKNFMVSDPSFLMYKI